MNNTFEPNPLSEPALQETAEPPLGEIHESPDLQTVFWNKEEVSKRARLLLETRVLKKLLAAAPSPIEVSEEEYQRFDQLMIRMTTASAEIDQDVRKAFRSKDLSNTEVARATYESIRSAQEHVRSFVEALMKRGNGKITTLLEAAADALNQPFNFRDLEEDALLLLLDGISQDVHCSASRFVRMEEKPDQEVNRNTVTQPSSETAGEKKRDLISKEGQVDECVQIERILIEEIKDFTKRFGSELRAGAAQQFRTIRRMTRKMNKISPELKVEFSPAVMVRIGRVTGEITGIVTQALYDFVAREREKLQSSIRMNAIESFVAEMRSTGLQAIQNLPEDIELNFTQDIFREEIHRLQENAGKRARAWYPKKSVKDDT